MRAQAQFALEVPLRQAVPAGGFHGGAARKFDGRPSGRLTLTVEELVEAVLLGLGVRGGLGRRGGAEAGDAVGQEAAEGIGAVLAVGDGLDARQLLEGFRDKNPNRTSNMTDGLTITFVN